MKRTALYSETFGYTLDVGITRTALKTDTVKSYRFRDLVINHQ